MITDRLPRPEFFDRAACRNEDPELFFPVGDIGRVNRRQIADALAVCQRCPVVTDCREWALATGQAYGIWGGLTEHERAGLIRQQGVAS